jgi:hypothetical protein
MVSDNAITATKKVIVPIIKEPLATRFSQPSTTSSLMRIRTPQQKKKKKLTFKSTPIIIPPDEDLNLSISAETAVEDFLRNNHQINKQHQVLASPVDDNNEPPAMLASGMNLAQNLFTSETYDPSSVWIENEHQQYHNTQQREFGNTVQDTKQQKAQQQRERLHQLRMEQQELIKQSKELMMARSESPQHHIHQMEDTSIQDIIQQDDRQQIDHDHTTEIEIEEANSTIIDDKLLELNDSETNIQNHFLAKQERFRSILRMNAVNIPDHLQYEYSQEKKHNEFVDTFEPQSPTLNVSI